MAPCSCNKKRQTTGFGSTQRNAPVAPNPEPTAAPAAPQQTFTLVKPDGSRTTFGSKLEAVAARIRAGGGTIE